MMISKLNAWIKAENNLYYPIFKLIAFYMSISFSLNHTFFYDYLADVLFRIEKRQLGLFLDVSGTSFQMHAIESGMGFWKGDWMQFYINDSCLGIGMFVWQFSFSLAFYKKWLPSILNLLFSLLMIYLFNIFRLYILFFLEGSTMEIFHSGVAPFIANVIMLLLWIRFIKNQKDIKLAF